MPEAPFAPISPNPYIVGNPVREQSMFFGREADFQLVTNRFGSSREGGVIVFCGERRSGKTSILFQIMEGRLGPDFLPVLIDMQSMAIESEREFYAKIISEIIETLERKGIHLPTPDPGLMNRPSLQFMEFIDSLVARLPEKRPILLLDEYELLENKIDAGILSEDVLDVLAALLQKHPFFMVFTGSQDLEGRKQSYWRLLGQSIAKRISFLDESDAVQLITKPLEGRVTYADGTIERLVRLGAGQPFYTQALCQTIVDHLNDHQTNVVTHEVISSVVQAIVTNPFPQMIFLWESLTPVEKLTLSLLAEHLPNDAEFAKPSDLKRFIKRRRYPLALNESAIESALDELFEKDLLQKHSDVRRGYSYRMDLWRLWIMRAHAVWRVIRETGLRRSARRRFAAWAMAATAVVTVAFYATRASITSPRQDASRFAGPGAAPAVASAERPAFLTVTPTPSDAFVFVDAESIGRGRQQLRTDPGRERAVRVAASGYHDSTFSLVAGEDENVWRDVALRPRTGRLSLTSTPAGAKVIVDDVVRGVTPCRVAELDVNREHAIHLELEGHEPVRFRQSVAADTTLDLHRALSPRATAVMITTVPRHATIAFDDRGESLSPLHLENVTYGKHRIRVILPGHVPVDSTLVVTGPDPTFHFELRREPPGILIVQGQRLARSIWVDDVQIVANVYNSGPCTLSTGRHEVEVELSDSTIKTTIEIEPRQRLVYDYVQDRLSERD